MKNQSKAINIFNKLVNRKKNSFDVPGQFGQNPVYFLGFGLGSGTMPFAPAHLVP